MSAAPSSLHNEVCNSSIESKIQRDISLRQRLIMWQVVILIGRYCFIPEHGRVVSYRYIAATTRRRAIYASRSFREVDILLWSITNSTNESTWKFIPAVDCFGNVPIPESVIWMMYACSLLWCIPPTTWTNCSLHPYDIPTNFVRIPCHRQVGVGEQCLACRSGDDLLLFRTAL